MLCSLVASYAGAEVFGDSGMRITFGLACAVASGFVVAVATVAAIYRVFPRTPPDWRSTLVGALIAAGSVSVLSAGYVGYLRLGANFEQRYASAALAAVVLLGLWLFAANIALLVGYRIAVRREGSRSPAATAVRRSAERARLSAVSSRGARRVTTRRGDG
jgi:uncharacterized BrkB/YihY/UPF0761 family membrane protein